MALYNEILVGRFNRALQKAMGIKGQPPSPQVGGEVTPGVSLFWGTDVAYLEGWNRFGGRVALAAVAANTGALRLRNPTSSGVLVVVERISITVGTVTNVILSVERPASAGTFPIVGSIMPWDSRISKTSTGGGNAAQLEGKTNNATTFGTAVGVFSPSAANVSIELIPAEIQHSIPLLPGDSLDVTINLANTSGDNSVFWRERVLEDSEVT